MSHKRTEIFVINRNNFLWKLISFQNCHFIETIQSELKILSFFQKQQNEIHRSIGEIKFDHIFTISVCKLSLHSKHIQEN